MNSIKISVEPQCGILHDPHIARQRGASGTPLLTPNHVVNIPSRTDEVSGLPEPIFKAIVTRNMKILMKLNIAKAAGSHY